MTYQEGLFTVDGGRVFFRSDGLGRRTFFNPDLKRTLQRRSELNLPRVSLGNDEVKFALPKEFTS